MHTVIYMRHGTRFIFQCPQQSPNCATRCASMTEVGRGEGWRDGGPLWLRFVLHHFQVFKDFLNPQDLGQVKHEDTFTIDLL